MGELTGITGEDVRKGFKKQLRGLQFVGGLASGLAVPAIATGITELGIQALDKKDPGTAVATAAGASVLDLVANKFGAPLIGAGFKKIKPILKPIAKAAKKTTSFVAEVLSSVPREFFERAVTKEVAGG